MIALPPLIVATLLKKAGADCALFSISPLLIRQADAVNAFPIAMLGEKNKNEDGWTVAKRAAEKSRGGATYVLHMPNEWSSHESERMRNDGWNTFFIQKWEDIVPFAKEFAKKHYE
jgi:hypothetical protein